MLVLCICEVLFLLNGRIVISIMVDGVHVIIHIVHWSNNVNHIIVNVVVILMWVRVDTNMFTHGSTGRCLRCVH